MNFFGFRRSDLQLLLNLARLGLRDRYLATSLGGIWAVLNPLMMFGLYTFVFGFVLKVRVDGDDNALAYVIWLIAAYGPWLATVEGVSVAASSVVGNTGLVKNLTFKTELLPLAGVLVSAVPMAIGLAFVLLLLALSGTWLCWTIALLPLIVGLHLLLLMGVGLWLAAVTVFYRDVLQVIPSAMTAILFFSPIFYSIDSMPFLVRVLSAYNPVFIFGDAYRCCIIRGAVPDLTGMLVVAVLGGFVFVSGLRTFRRCKGYFVGSI